ncbi:MAG: hypothetical protein ABIH41_02565, partial [Nanoarchaeota archaeon]
MAFSLLSVQLDRVGEGFKVAVGAQRVVPVVVQVVSVEVFDPSMVSVSASRDVSLPSSQTRYTYAFGVLASTADGQTQYHVQDYLGT